jgi:hypothetical protein
VENLNSDLKRQIIRKLTLYDFPAAVRTFPDTSPALLTETPASLASIGFSFGGMIIAGAMDKFDGRNQS